MKHIGIFIGVLLIAIISVTQARNSSSEETTPSSDFFVEEHDRAIISEGASQPPAAKGELGDYTKEKELIVSQLEVITGDEETRYIIVPGDTLTIAYRDRSKSEQGVYQVSGAGEIHMPLIGAVKVAGLNRQQAREKINECLKEYIRQPELHIGINADGRFMVVGAVSSPGVYPLQPNLTIMEAILRAQYIKGTANLGSVLLMRGGFDNPIVTRLNLKKMIARGDRDDNVPIKPGDLIYIPTTFISELDAFQRNVYRHILTYYGLGGFKLLNQ